jgi:hypothetical protein
MAEDHFVLYLMLMAILGTILGFVGTLLIYVVLAWQRVGAFVFDMLSLGVT